MLVLLAATVPFLLLGLLLLAALLESRVIAPTERAIVIERWLATSPPDDLERDVARLLRVVDRPPPVR